MRLIDADTFVSVQLYDDEHEERYSERMTIAECIDLFTDEGCPQTIDAVSVVHGKWIERIGEISKELFYQCSKCYGEVDTDEFDYCPWCGAKMEGADDDSI